jgi:hypothetical protein
MSIVFRCIGALARLATHSAGEDRLPDDPLLS